MPFHSRCPCVVCYETGPIGHSFGCLCLEAFCMHCIVPHLSLAHLLLSALPVAASAVIDQDTDLCRRLAIRLASPICFVRGRRSLACATQILSVFDKWLNLKQRCRTLASCYAKAFRTPPESDTDSRRWVSHHERKCGFKSCRARHRLCESLTMLWFSLGRITGKNARDIPAALLRFCCTAQAGRVCRWELSSSDAGPNGCCVGRRGE